MRSGYYRCRNGLNVNTEGRPRRDAASTPILTNDNYFAPRTGRGQSVLASSIQRKPHQTQACTWYTSGSKLRRMGVSSSNVLLVLNGISSAGKPDRKADMLHLQPISFNEAAQFIRAHHRHHLPPVGWKYGIAVNDGEKVVGVVTVGRPVARHFDNGYTLEVTRCCTTGEHNAASMLYGAAWRAARALGYRRLISYTLQEEAGTSLKAAGWKVVGQTQGGSWDTPSRPRVDKAPTGIKTLWEAA